MNSGLVREFEKLLGPSSVLYRPEDLLLYEYDGSVVKGRPDLVVFPDSSKEVSRIVRLAAGYNIPIVGRGAGTGLSGGALARTGGVMLVFARMNRILALDTENQRAVVQPGVVNYELTRAAEPYGLYFAPDPSSWKSCTIGGNVAENAGGPHTLAYGVTTNHVTALQLVLPDGEIVRLGGPHGDTPGYDLTGLFVGSEGTLTGSGAITKSGGRVVKNVTGYDLHKLLIGSLGTLAVITCLNFRTFPAPLAGSRGFVASFPNAEGALALRRAIAQSPLTPLTLDIVSPGLAQIFATQAPATPEIAVFPGENRDVGSNSLPPIGDWFHPCEWHLCAAFAGTPEVLDRYKRDLSRLAGESGAISTASSTTRRAPPCGDASAKLFPCCSSPRPSSASSN